MLSKNIKMGCSLLSHCIFCYYKFWSSLAEVTNLNFIMGWGNDLFNIMGTFWKDF